MNRRSTRPTGTSEPSSENGDGRCPPSNAVSPLPTFPSLNGGIFDDPSPRPGDAASREPIWLQLQPRRQSAPTSPPPSHEAEGSVNAVGGSTPQTARMDPPDENNLSTPAPPSIGRHVQIAHDPSPSRMPLFPVLLAQDEPNMARIILMPRGSLERSHSPRGVDFVPS